LTLHFPEILLHGSKREFISVFALNLFVCSLIGFLLYQSRIKYEKQADVSTQNLATVKPEIKVIMFSGYNG
jgi:hypothetical protein